MTRQLETSGAWVHQEVVLSRLVVDGGGGGRGRGLLIIVQMPVGNS